MNFKLFPFRELEDSYKEQSPFSLPLSQTEGKHINKRAHWQARRHAMRSSKAGEGVHTTPPTPWGHGRRLCPHHQETPLSLPVHSNSSLKSFHQTQLRLLHSTSTNTRKSCYLLRDKDFRIIKIVPILVKANIFNGDSYCYTANVLG